MSGIRRRSMVIATALGIASLAFGVSAASAAPHPPGNNGTVKVEGEAIDKLHDNDPHVGCDFFIQWYGFDEGVRTSTATFSLHPPSGSGEQLLADTFTFEGHGSGNTLDVQRPYDLTDALSGRTPQKQGFHIRLDVKTDGSQGADMKHKVFWVSGCPESVGGTVTQPETGDQPEVSPGGGSEQGGNSDVPAGGTNDVVTPPTGGAGAVLGESETAASGTPAEVAGVQITRTAPKVEGAALPRTGIDVEALVLLAWILMAVGGTLLLLRRPDVSTE